MHERRDASNITPGAGSSRSRNFPKPGIIMREGTMRVSEIFSTGTGHSDSYSSGGGYGGYGHHGYGGYGHYGHYSDYGYGRHYGGGLLGIRINL